MRERAPAVAARTRRSAIETNYARPPQCLSPYRCKVTSPKMRLNGPKKRREHSRNPLGRAGTLGPWEWHPRSVSIARSSSNRAGESTGSRSGRTSGNVNPGSGRVPREAVVELGLVAELERRDAVRANALDQLPCSSVAASACPAIRLEVDAQQQPRAEGLSQRSRDLEPSSRSG